MTNCPYCGQTQKKNRNLGEIERKKSKVLLLVTEPISLKDLKIKYEQKYGTIAKKYMAKLVSDLYIDGRLERIKYGVYQLR
jgi:hypothetical protein